MNGPIAQIVALTCYGNAFLNGKKTPQFFPDNSTCNFCDSINFTASRQRFLRQPKTIEVAKSPDEWISSLQFRQTVGVRLVRQAHNNPAISDRMSAGFVGGGGTWLMELVKKNGCSEFWAARWNVWNQNAPEQRIWRVSYGLLAEERTRQQTERDLTSVKNDLRKSLVAIHRFSEQQNCDGFTTCFADALKALDDPTAEIGYHRDLAIPRQLNDDAQSMLKAAMSAWVFGGMGSWNDMGFEVAVTQSKYESVSESLFNVINEAIEASTNSTMPSEATR